MKKWKFILIITLWLILLNFSIGLAQVEVKNEANELYKKISSIMVRGIKYEIKDGKLDIAMDYALEILKKYPESLEAYYILKKSFMFNIMFLRFPKAYEKYEKWYKLILDNPDNLNVLNDPDVYMAEKLMVTMLYYVILTGSGSISDIDFFSTKHEKFLIAALKNMRENCKNESYSALATIMLFRQSRNYKNLFVNNYPRHSVVPILKLETAVEFADNKNYKKAIKEIEKLINTYKDVVLPDGWKFEIECYERLVWAYRCIDDYRNVKKYYMLIMEKAPDYPYIGYINIETINCILNRKEKEQK
jgi:tetratricopeptide (TPR) repeat protein